MTFKRWFGILAVSFVVGMAIGDGRKQEARADRTDVWANTSVKVYKVDLTKLADGGCSVQAFATYTKQDGGLLAEGTATVDVAGVNRTDCLNIINVRAPVLFKADKGL